MDQPGAGFGINRCKFEILAICACRFGFFLGVQTQRQTSARFSAIRLNFQSVPKFRFRFGELASSQCRRSEVFNGRDVVGIQMNQRLKGFGSFALFIDFVVGAVVPIMLFLLQMSWFPDKLLKNVGKSQCLFC